MQIEIPPPLGDSEWTALTNEQARSVATDMIGRAIAHITGHGLALDAWEAHHLDAAIKFVGEGRYVNADVYARQAVVVPIMRTNLPLTDGQIATAGSLSVRLLQSSHRLPAPKLKC